MPDIGSRHHKEIINQFTDSLWCQAPVSEIDIYGITKKNASFRVKLTYAGGVTKTVTVRVKKK